MNKIMKKSERMYSVMKDLRQYEETKNVGRAWSKREENLLIEELSQGKNVIEIAEIHGRTVRGITSRRNLLMRNEPSINIEELSIKYGLSKVECSKILKDKLEEMGNTNVTTTKMEEMENRIKKLEMDNENLNKKLIEMNNLFEQHLKLLEAIL